MENEKQQQTLVSLSLTESICPPAHECQDQQLEHHHHPHHHQHHHDEEEDHVHHLQQQEYRNNCGDDVPYGDGDVDHSVIQFAYPVDPTLGDYIILNSMTPHVQQHEAQPVVPYNILDQSVQELFREEEELHHQLQQEQDMSQGVLRESNVFHVSERNTTTTTMTAEDEEEEEDTSDSLLSTAYNTSSNANHSDSDNSTRSTSSKVSPFSEECLIPLPGRFESGFTSHRPFVRRRNERERARVRSVNDGFERLRAHLPITTEDEPKDRRLSKVETLRFAIQYIEHLQSLLKDE